MMLKLVTYFNKMLKKSSIEYGDLEITQTSTETISEETSRSLNDLENMSEEEQISEVITDKLSRFIRTRSLKWKVSLKIWRILKLGFNSNRPSKLVTNRRELFSNNPIFA